MKSIILKFPSLEELGAFVRFIERGHYTNTAHLSVKGTFTEEEIFLACKAHGATAIAA